MNQNYVNLIQIFLREEWKNMFLKVGSVFLSEAFQFIITEMVYPNKLFNCYNLITPFTYVIAQMLSPRAALMIMQH